MASVQDGANGAKVLEISLADLSQLAGVPVTMTGNHYRPGQYTITLSRTLVSGFGNPYAVRVILAPVPDPAD